MEGNHHFAAAVQTGSSHPGASPPGCLLSTEGKTVPVQRGAGVRQNHHWNHSVSVSAADHRTSRPPRPSHNALGRTPVEGVGFLPQDSLDVVPSTMSVSRKTKGAGCAALGTISFPEH